MNTRRVKERVLNSSRFYQFKHYEYMSRCNFVKNELYSSLAGKDRPRVGVGGVVSTLVRCVSDSPEAQHNHIQCILAPQNGTQSYMSRLVTKPTKWHVPPAKTQISLGIRPV